MKKLAILVFFLTVTLVGFSQKPVIQNDVSDNGTTVMMETNFGDIIIHLYDGTPMHRDNFIKLVESNFYDGLLFHRVIKDFMIQGGDPQSKEAKQYQPLGSGSIGYTIPAEFRPGLYYHKRGALCAARQGDDVNPQRVSSGSQFYIVQGQRWDEKGLKMIEEKFHKKFTPEMIKTYMTIGGAPHLDNEYTVFGEVVKGMEVVDKIVAIPCDNMDRPIEDVRIISVKVLNNKLLK